MSEVILERPNNVERRTCSIGHSDTTRTNLHWPLIFSHPEDLTNDRLMENKKAEILERLKNADEKLKDAHKEINEAVLAALEMKEAGDDIAEQMLVAMAAQDDIRNAEIIVGQTQTKMIHERLRKKFLTIPQDVVIVKDVPFEDRLREAEKPLYLWRYE
jgi:hypothetical protein